MYFDQVMGPQPGEGFAHQLWWMIAHRLLPEVLKREVALAQSMFEVPMPRVAIHETRLLWSVFCSNVLLVEGCSVASGTNLGLLDELPTAIGLRIDGFQPEEERDTHLIIEIHYDGKEPVTIQLGFPQRGEMGSGLVRAAQAHVRSWLGPMLEGLELVDVWKQRRFQGEPCAVELLTTATLGFAGLTPSFVELRVEQVLRIDASHLGMRRGSGAWKLAKDAAITVTRNVWTVGQNSDPMEHLAGVGLFCERTASVRLEVGSEASLSVELDPLLIVAASEPSSTRRKQSQRRAERQTIGTGDLGRAYPALGHFLGGLALPLTALTLHGDTRTVSILLEAQVDGSPQLRDGTRLSSASVHGELTERVASFILEGLYQRSHKIYVSRFWIAGRTDARCVIGISRLAAFVNDEGENELPSVRTDSFDAALDLLGQRDEPTITLNIFPSSRTHTLALPAQHETQARIEREGFLAIDGAPPWQD